MKSVQFKLATLILGISFAATANMDINELTINDLHKALISNQTTVIETMQDYLVMYRPKMRLL